VRPRTLKKEDRVKRNGRVKKENKKDMKKN
jgi:hypothetical protein